MRILRVHPRYRDPLRQAITLAAYKRLEQAGALNRPLTDKPHADQHLIDQGFNDNLPFK